MRKPILFFCMLLGLLLPKGSYGNALLGGEITYTCVGPDSFLVSLGLNSDCTHAPLPNTQNITATAPGCSPINLTVVLRLSPINITPLCPSWNDPCVSSGGPLVYGVNQYWYEGLLVIPSGMACETWHLSWVGCCLSEHITNLIPHAGTQMNLYTRLYRGSAGDLNSSPQFVNSPSPFECKGSTFSYNHGVLDPDGDSLAFSLVPCQSSPLSSGIQDTPTSSNYQFITPSLFVSLNGSTGQIEMRSTAVETVVICLRVEEFRGGVKIGEVLRTMVVTIFDCNINKPQLIIDPPGVSFDTAVCPGQSLAWAFTTTMWDTTRSDRICLSWNYGIPAATFTITHGANHSGCYSKYPSANFSWTPTKADEGFHFFSITLRSDGCPITTSNTTAFSIEVRSPNISLPDTLSMCKGQSIELVQNMVFSTIDFTHFQWFPGTGVADPSALYNTFNPQEPTTYTLVASNGLCADTATMHVRVHEVDTFVTTAHTTLIAQEPGAYYQWVDCGNGHTPVPGATARDFRPDSTGSYAVIVSKYGCTDTSACHYVLLTGIENAGHNPRIRLYPNPAKGTLYVELESNRAGNYVLQLLNPAGQRVLRETLQVSIGVTTVQMDIAHLPAGLYQVVVAGEDGRRVQKLVVME